jgi:hypothetical protein
LDTLLADWLYALDVQLEQTCADVLAVHMQEVGGKTADAQLLLASSHRFFE